MCWLAPGQVRTAGQSSRRGLVHTDTHTHTPVLLLLWQWQPGDAWLLARIHSIWQSRWWGGVVGGGALVAQAAVLEERERVCVCVCVFVCVDVDVDMSDDDVRCTLCGVLPPRAPLRCHDATQ